MFAFQSKANIFKNRSQWVYSKDKLELLKIY